jgi:hypothetical protein
VIYAKASNEDRWRVIGRARSNDVAFEWPADWRRNNTIIEQLEFELEFAPDADGSRLTRILLYPSAEQGH